MKRKLILHIGLPKTGTSSLQELVFPNIKTVRYLGRTDGILGSDLRDIEEQFGHLFYSPSNLVDISVKTLIKLIYEKELSLYDQTSDLPLLVSSEIITSHIFLPIFKYRFGLWALEPQRVFSRLKVFQELSEFNLEIILTKRNPKQFVHSYYAQQYYIFRNISQLNTLKKYVDFGTDERKGNILGYLFNNKLEKEIQQFFKEDQIRIWQFEDVFKNISEFISKEFKDNFENDGSRKVNVRSHNASTKLGDIRPIWENRKPIKMAIKSALRFYTESRKNREELKVKIKWTNDLDDYFKKYD